MAYANSTKLARAKAWAKEQGKANDEDVIHDRYVALGGLITEGDEVQTQGSKPASALPKAPRVRKPVAPKTDTTTQA